MKKYIIMSLILMAGLAVYNGMQKGWFKGNRGERRDFAIGDTAGLDKIFMADKGGKKILLEKISGVWMVNGKYEVNQGWFKQLIETITKVQVKSVIPKNALNSVIKNLSSDHIKVEIYKKGELEKVYFVGGSTQDMMGTYMWIENSEVPFICEVPGFEGFLQPRYNLNEIAWRSRKVFGYIPERINSIKVQYHDQDKQGFVIEQKGNQVSLKDLSGVVIPQFDSVMVKYYIALYKEVHAEAFGMLYKELSSDSVRQLPYWCRIEVQDAKGTQSLNIHKMMVTERSKQQFTTDGKALDLDAERYYAFKNDSKDVMMIQDYVFGNFFRSVGDFISRKSESRKL